MQVCLIHPSIPTAPHALCRRAPRSESSEGKQVLQSIGPQGSGPPVYGQDGSRRGRSKCGECKWHKKLQMRSQHLILPSKLCLLLHRGKNCVLASDKLGLALKNSR